MVVSLNDAQTRTLILSIEMTALNQLAIIQNGICRIYIELYNYK